MKTAFFMLLLLLSAPVWSQSADCSGFKTGTFTYETPNFGTVTIERTAGKQVEKVAEGSSQVHSSLKWLSDCRYEVTYETLVNNDMKEMIGKKNQVEVVAVNGKVYTCRITDGNNVIGTLEMTKVK